MKNRLFGIFAAIIALSFTALLTGCDGVNNLTKTVLTGITAAYNGTAAIYPTTPINDLKTNLTVKAQYSDNNEETLLPDNYTLSGVLTIGTSTITVTYTHDGVTKTDEFTVPVTAAPVVTNPQSADDITYSVGQIGGIDNKADSTYILFTFSASVDSFDLTAADVTVSGAAEKGPAAELIGTGLTRMLAITVTSAGQAAVVIAKTGIETGQRHTTVYKAGQTAATLTGITADYDDAFAVHPHTPLESLKDHLTVTAIYSDGEEVTLPDDEYEIDGDLSQYGDTDITVTYEDKTCTFTVNVVTDTSIDKTDPTVTWPTGLKATLGQTLADVALDACVNIGGEPGTFSWTTPTASVGELGERTHNMIFTPEDLEDYNVINGNVTITVIEGCVDHTWGEWGQTRAATVTEDGEEKRTCTVCNTIETRPLWATGTVGLAYFLTNGDTEYEVAKQNYLSPVTPPPFPTVHIPAWWRPADSTDYADYKPVTKIATFGGFNSTTYAETTLTTLTFAEDRQPTIIQADAFQYCTALSSVTIPAGVTIGNNAFRYNTGLTEVTLNEGVTISGNYAFSACTNLISITLNEGVTISGNYAFSGGGTGITEVNIPDGVTISGSNTFQNCTGITSVTISAGVTSIPSNTFSGCTGLISITVDPENSDYVSQDGILYNKAKTSFIHIPTKVNGAVTIPEGIATIGSSAFSGRTDLTSITLPASVTSIATNAFQNCSSLTSITIPENVATIANTSFSRCTSLTSINVDANNPYFAGDGGILYNKAKTELLAFPSASGAVTIPANVTTIGSAAFSQCTILTSITIPATVTTIVNSAFNGCTELISVTFAGTIASGSFGTSNPFPGDLRAKFYSQDSANGTPGTYTTTAPVGTSSVWTKE